MSYNSLATPDEHCSGKHCLELLQIELPDGRPVEVGLSQGGGARCQQARAWARQAGDHCQRAACDHPASSEPRHQPCRWRQGGPHRDLLQGIIYGFEQNMISALKKENYYYS